MRKFICLFFIMCWSSIFASCETEDDYMFDGKKDSTIVADTIIRHDTIIIHNDSTHTNDTIIKTDTIINKDTIISIYDKKVILDFEALSDENIKVEKGFKMNNTSSSLFQGMAVWGDFLFQTFHSKNYIDVYDLRDNHFLYSIKSSGENDIHCNNADFGNQFYTESDPFPLLYLEHRGNSCKTSVFRIVEKGTVFTLQKVQTILFSPCSWCITNNDAVNGFMYITHGTNTIPHTIKVKIPPVDVGNVSISLDPDSCLDYFKDNEGIKVGQDATIYKNKIFQLRGYSGEGEIRIIDLIKHNVIHVIDLNKFGMTGEPEGIVWYKDHLIVSILGGQTYNIYFVK